MRKAVDAAKAVAAEQKTPPAENNQKNAAA
jgi:hypothetical protein